MNRRVLNPTWTPKGRQNSGPKPPKGAQRPFFNRLVWGPGRALTLWSLCSLYNLRLKAYRLGGVEKPAKNQLMLACFFGSRLLWLWVPHSSLGCLCSISAARKCSLNRRCAPSASRLRSLPWGGPGISESRSEASQL